MSTFIVEQSIIEDEAKKANLQGMTIYTEETCPPDILVKLVAASEEERLALPIPAEKDRKKGALMIMVEGHDTLVSFCFAEFGKGNKKTKKEVTKTKHAWVTFQTVFTFQGYTGQGFAKVLINIVIRAGKENGALYFCVNAGYALVVKDQLVESYKKMGFKESDPMEGNQFNLTAFFTKPRRKDESVEDRANYLLIWKENVGIPSIEESLRKQMAIDEEMRKRREELEKLKDISVSVSPMDITDKDLETQLKRIAEAEAKRLQTIEQKEVVEENLENTRDKRKRKVTEESQESTKKQKTAESFEVVSLVSSSEEEGEQKVQEKKHKRTFEQDLEDLAIREKVRDTVMCRILTLCKQKTQEEKDNVSILGVRFSNNLVGQMILMGAKRIVNSKSESIEWKNFACELCGESIASRIIYWREEKKRADIDELRGLFSNIRFLNGPREYIVKSDTTPWGALSSEMAVCASCVAVMMTTSYRIEDGTTDDPDVVSDDPEDVLGNGPSLTKPRSSLSNRGLFKVTKNKDGQWRYYNLEDLSKENDRDLFNRKMRVQNAQREIKDWNKRELFG
jgi:GNAT superfamily N-acetyltransferase